jgi:hypothetical protein
MSTIDLKRAVIRLPRSLITLCDELAQVAKTQGYRHVSRASVVRALLVIGAAGTREDILAHVGLTAVPRGRKAPSSQLDLPALAAPTGLVQAAQAVAAGGAR